MKQKPWHDSKPQRRWYNKNTSTGTHLCKRQWKIPKAMWKTLRGGPFPNCNEVNPFVRKQELFWRVKNTHPGLLTKEGKVTKSRTRNWSASFFLRRIHRCWVILNDWTRTMTRFLFLTLKRKEQNNFQQRRTLLFIAAEKSAFALNKVLNFPMCLGKTRQKRKSKSPAECSLALVGLNIASKASSYLLFYPMNPSDLHGSCIDPIKSKKLELVDLSRLSKTPVMLQLATKHFFPQHSFLGWSHAPNICNIMTSTSQSTAFEICFQCQRIHFAGAVSIEVSAVLKFIWYCPIQKLINYK